VKTAYLYVYVDHRKLLTLESNIDKSVMQDMIVDNNDIDEDELIYLFYQYLDLIFDV
jgi:hypothetical protein